MNLREVAALSDGDLDGLSALLVAVVNGGGTVGFLPPVSIAEAGEYWRGVLGPGVVLLVAEDGGRVLGTVQLQMSMRTNGLHRAEVAKMMVHPEARRQGIGRRLMEAIEAVGRREGRSLLVLDTREGDVSNELYRGRGFIEAGRIPGYARSDSGELHTTVIYYRQLA